MKKLERVEALLFVMTICILVYAALEYHIRQALEKTGKRWQTKRANRGIDLQHAGYSSHLWTFHVLELPDRKQMVIDLK